MLRCVLVKTLVILYIMNLMRCSYIENFCINNMLDMFKKRNYIYNNILGPASPADPLFQMIL